MTDDPRVFIVHPKLTFIYKYVYIDMVHIIALCIRFSQGYLFFRTQKITSLCPWKSIIFNRNPVDLNTKNVGLFCLIYGEKNLQRGIRHVWISKNMKVFVTRSDSIFTFSSAVLLFGLGVQCWCEKRL